MNHIVISYKCYNYILQLVNITQIAMVYDTFFCGEFMGLHQPSLAPQMAAFFTSKVRLLRWGQPGRLGLGGLASKIHGIYRWELILFQARN